MRGGSGDLAEAEGAVTAKQLELIWQAFFTVLQFADGADLAGLQRSMIEAQSKKADPRIDLFLGAIDTVLAGKMEVV